MTYAYLMASNATVMNADINLCHQAETNEQTQTGQRPVKSLKITMTSSLGIRVTTRCRSCRRPGLPCRRWSCKRRGCCGHPSHDVDVERGCHKCLGRSMCRRTGPREHWVWRTWSVPITHFCAPQWEGGGVAYSWCPPPWEGSGCTDCCVHLRSALYSQLQQFQLQPPTPPYFPAHP